MLIVIFFFFVARGAQGEHGGTVCNWIIYVARVYFLEEPIFGGA